MFDSHPLASSRIRSLEFALYRIMGTRGDYIRILLGSLGSNLQPADPSRVSFSRFVAFISVRICLAWYCLECLDFTTDSFHFQKIPDNHSYILFDICSTKYFWHSIWNFFSYRNIQITTLKYIFWIKYPIKTHIVIWKNNKHILEKKIIPIPWKWIPEYL